MHSLRRCIEDNWLSDNFVVFKVDILNAFNMVSKQAVLNECATFFPELLPWVSWCYGSHSSLWHLMGQVSSQSGVQQGDPLGPMLFALVLHKLVTSIEVDDDCLHLILEAWYLDDGVLAGERSTVIHALHLIEELGPHLGLHINLSKCELFSRNGNSHFPPVVESSLLPNLDIQTKSSEPKLHETPPLSENSYFTTDLHSEWDLATLNCEGSNNEENLFLRMVQIHFPVSLRNVSPTAMGLTSGGLPSLLLSSAISLLPSKYADTRTGTFPEARRFTIPLREVPIGVRRGTDMVSKRC